MKFLLQKASLVALLLLAASCGKDKDAPFPTTDSGTVYVGSDDGKIYALNAADGTKKWEFTTGGVVRASPTVADGIVYVGSQDNKVYALNAVDGSKKWEFTTGDDVHNSPTVVNGIVYVGSWDNKVYALNAAPTVPKSGRLLREGI